ncbi:hypothetical protein [Chryseobacterium indoltheticum]|uniref:hypothetical protein n=1 Tax=Chryseobacterium indoltheticum TaxID=254 RepID=UPI00242C58B6|nr:hypothetical protein [Chryseobacterium indoltheticum]
MCFGSRVLDTFFCAALRKTLELTKPFSYRVNNTSLRVGFEKNRIEKFLMGRHILCFDSLVLDTFFCATLRKTLELTKLFSYRANKTSLRVIFAKNLIEKFLMGRQILCFSSAKNHIEKFLLGRQILCFSSLVLDTFSTLR